MTRGGVAIKPFIRTHFDLCTGCNICQLACSMQHFGGYNIRRSLLAIHNTRENLYHKPVVCAHCSNAYCMNVCPADAYDRRDDGAVLIDPDRCVGCGLCVTYCPEGMVSLDPDSGKAVKCDLCGGSPACVAACPTCALEWNRGDEIDA